MEPGIGFANLVRRGPIGIIGSAGTGMQELSCLVHQSGSGISHGIGTGSRDLSDVIGGISTMTAIDALESDPGNEGNYCSVQAAWGENDGPAHGSAPRMQKDRWWFASLGQMQRTPRGMSDRQPLSTRQSRPHSRLLELPRLRNGGPKRDPLLRWQRQSLRKCGQGNASFAVCLQAAHSVTRRKQYCARRAWSLTPTPLFPECKLADPRKSRGNSLVDMGAEVFVEGRPHPMIDATLRRQRLAQEGDDPTVAIVLLDFILGAISSRDPVGDLLGAIRGVQDAARRKGNHLCVVASVCGTNEDAQGLQSQTRALVDAGVCVFSSNARAAAFCREAALLLAKRGEAD